MGKGRAGRPHARLQQILSFETTTENLPSTGLLGAAMPFQAQCPSCDNAISLAESERGRKVRCPLCNGEFVAGAAPPLTDLSLESFPDDTRPAEVLEPA